MAGLGISINEKLQEGFSKMVAERGMHKYRAVEAAIRAFMVLPKAAQVELMAEDVDALKVLVDTFRDIALQEDLQRLSPEKQAQIISLAKEVAKQFSRKKKAL